LPPADLQYNAAAFAHVPLDADVLAMITSFVPSRVELFPALAPFFPDYLPAAGAIDPFLRPPRPDGREGELGARRLPEPAALQSDPTVLDLQLRALSKKSGLEPVAVRALEHAERNPKEILKWAASIAELRRSAPPPSVHYSRPMPEVEALMQEWPAPFEQLLRQVRLARPAAGSARVLGGPPTAPPPPTPGATADGALTQPPPSPARRCRCPRLTWT
jgi:intraflagellar transport protein 46